MFLFKVGFLTALETNSSRIEKLEKEIEELRDQLHELLIEKVRPSASPDLLGKDWFVTFDALYWYARTNETAFAYSNHTQDTTLPLRGRTKDLNFHWSWGFRAGLGKNLDFDKWDLYLYFTYYRSHVSGSAHAGLASTLIPLRGVTVQDEGVGSAKSTYALDFYNLDLELGRHYYVSSKLSLRPFVGVKSAWIDQKQAIRYTAGSLGYNSAHVDDLCEYWGVGLRGGIKSRWHLGSGWRLEGLFAGALLYGFFDIDHSEKLTPSRDDRVKLEDNKHRFIPTVQWRMGIGWGTYFNEKRNYLELGAAYEGMYWWRQNQMIKVYEYRALRYDNFSEDMSMHGLTLMGRLYF